MNGRTLVLCPTRDHPDAVIETHLSMRATAKNADMVLCVDDDQKSMYEHLLESGLMISSAPRESIVTALNTGVAAHPDYSYYGLVVDDAKFTIPGWDDWVAETISGFPNRLGVVSAHHNVGTFVNFPFVSREWLDLVGWYACPGTNRFCWDTVLEMLGEATRIEYAPESKFHIEHELLRNDSAVNIFTMDAVQFLGWCVNARRDLVQKIREAMR